MGIFDSVRHFFHYLKLRWKVFLLRRALRVARSTDKRPNFPPDRTLFIDGPGGKGRIQLNIYEPSALSSMAGRKPVHLNWHGSGFVLPMQGTDGRFCRLLSERVGCIVVDGDYRKAPEHPFPSGYEDVERTVQWALANVNNQFTPGKISVGGFSSGANLALCVAGQYSGVIKAVTSFYPKTDATIAYKDKKAPPVTRLDRKDRIGIVIPIPIGELFQQSYLIGLKKRGLTAADPRCSPTKADPDNFPDKQRTLVVECEYDYLAAEEVDFVEKLRQADREPVEYFAKGMGHAWDHLCKEGTEASKKRDEAWELAIEVLQRAYAD